MKTVLVDKIASITQALNLGHELRVATTDIPCEEGVVLVVEILNNKSTYNTLELTSGRMAKLAKGDVIVGALGHRQALFGYSGHLPESVKEGDVIQVLNIGGVLGIVDSVNPEKGRPFDAKVIGVVLQFPYLGERIGVPARVGYQRLDYNATVNTRGVPVVALAGTCMEAGKTAAACAIVARMRHRGLNVHAFKATGVSLRRDILAMEDAGARRSMIFTDLGVVTTTAKTGPAITRALLTEMSQGEPDVIVFELGDGILGAYGVEAILSSPDIQGGAVVRRAVRERSGRGVGRREAAAREVRHRARGRHRACDGQRGRREHHSRPVRRARVQRDHRRREARRLHHRGAEAEDEAAADRGVGLKSDLTQMQKTPVIVLGGTGYVAGDLLRLIAAHPQLELKGVLSDSQPGEPVAKSFVHLAPVYPELKFCGPGDDHEARRRRCRSRRSFRLRRTASLRS